VQNAYFLAGNKKVKFSQSVDKNADANVLSISLPPTAPDANDSVLVLDIDGTPNVDASVIQQPGGAVDLDAYLGDIHKAGKDSTLRMDTRGVAERWTNKEDWLGWNFKVLQPGSFDVVLISSGQKNNHKWEGGHEVAIEVAGQKITGTMANDGEENDPVKPYWNYWNYVVSKLGRVTIPKAGSYQLSLKPEAILSEQKLGLTLVEVKLVPAQNNTRAELK
jgi:hypothetical protein